MNELLNLLGYSVKAVLTILFIAGAGVILVRLRIINDKALHILSQLVFSLFLPCLLFTKLANEVNLILLKEWIFLPVSCVVYIITGTFLGFLISKLVHTRKEFTNCAIAASGFGNSGFIPIPLVIAVATIVPLFAERAGASALGVAYISVFLIGFTPMYWTVGYGLISGKKIKEIPFNYFITPPIIGLFSGIIIGIIPWLKSTICLPGGLLNSPFRAIEIIGDAAVPCSLIVLGGKLAFGPVRASINKETVFAVILAKLILLPTFAIGYVILLRSVNLIPNDPLFALVLIIEAAVPPGVNLVVMCNILKNGQDKSMATVLFWCYITSIPILTVFIMLSLWLFK